MVVKNPLTRGKWTAKKFQATVIPNITVELILFTGIAAGQSARFLSRAAC